MEDWYRRLRRYRDHTCRTSSSAGCCGLWLRMKFAAPLRHQLGKKGLKQRQSGETSTTPLDDETAIYRDVRRVV